MTDDDALFATRMQHLREEQDWSQGELARRCAAAGLENFHQTTISRIEKGTRTVRLGEARVIAETFGVTVAAMTAPGGSAEADRLAGQARAAKQAAMEAVEQMAVAYLRLGRLQAAGHLPAEP